MSGRGLTYEWLVIALLLLSPVLGVILFGAVRNWSAGGLMVTAYLAIGLFLLRGIRHHQEICWPPGGIPFLAFLLYAAVVLPLAAVPYEAKVELLKIGSYLGAYAVWTDISRRDGRWRMVLFVLLLLGIGVALYAIILHMNGSNAVLNLVREEGYGMRASGTFMAPAHLGAYMGMMICLATAAALIRGAGPLLRGLSIYGLLLFFPALVLSGSRSGWVGTLLGLPVVLLLMAGKRSLRALILTIIGFPIVAGAAILSLWLVYPEFQERLDSAIKIEGSAAWRLEAWKDTGEMIKDRPVIGHGPGSYRWLYSPYQSWSGDRWLRYAHNEYLHLWAEYGAIGLGLMAVFMVTLLASGLWLYGRAELQRDIGLLAGFIGMLVAALGHGITDFNFHVYSLMQLLALMGGLAMGGCFRSGLLQARSPPAPIAIAGRSLLALGCLAGMVVSLQVGVSGALVRLAETDMEQVDFRQANPYQRARGRLARAEKIDPGNWSIHMDQGHLSRREAVWMRDPERKRAKFMESVAFYEKALARNPYDMNVVFGLGRTWMDLGENEQGFERLRQASQHAPNNVFYARELGIQLRHFGYHAEALESFNRAHHAGGWNDPAVQANRRWLARELQRRAE